MVILILIGLGIWDYFSPAFNMPWWGWLIGAILAIIELAIYTRGKALDLLEDIGDLF